MQSGFNSMGKLYIKFAMNFVLPFAKGGEDFLVPTKIEMRDMAIRMIGRQFTICGGPPVGSITDYENPSFGHYIFCILIKDGHKDMVLRIISKNQPSFSMDVKSEQTIDQKGQN